MKILDLQSLAGPETSVAEAAGTTKTTATTATTSITSILTTTFDGNPELPIN